MAQFAAVMLALMAGASLGLTAANDGRPDVAIESAVALAFFAIATIAPLRDPREALTVLALAFCAHALVDISHRPGLLPDQLAPRWFVVGCAIHNLVRRRAVLSARAAPVSDTGSPSYERICVPAVLRASVVS